MSARQRRKAPRPPTPWPRQRPKLPERSWRFQYKSARPVRYRGKLFRFGYEGADEGTTLVGAAPLRAESVAVEAIGQGVCRHGMVQLGQGPVPDFFVTADMVAFIHRASADLGQVSRREGRLHAVNIVVRQSQVDRLIVNSDDVLQ